MDEKTVIAPGRKPPKAAATSEAAPPPTDATVIKKVAAAAPPAPEPPKASASPPAKAGGKKKVEKSAPPPPAAAPPKVSGFKASTIFLAMVAVLLVGVGSALTTIYLLSSFAPNPSTEVSEQDLNADIVAVQSDASEAEDEALIKAAIEPRVIELSGDPVIVRQLGSAPRQLLKLDSQPQTKAAQDLGIASDIFRLKDVLDVPSAGLQAGVVGSQDNFIALQPAAEPDATSADSHDDGSSVIMADTSTTADRVTEFAQVVKEKAALSSLLIGLGADPARAAAAEGAFATFYHEKILQKDYRVAVRAIPEEGNLGKFVPAQISVYGQQDLIGTIALNDIDGYSQAEDPWYQRDIFSAPLLPDQTDPANQPRLLDAIYASALRNRLPTPVVGEAIMLLSRAQDLEQKVQAGDTITLIYSPVARNPKTGLGRIVFISIGRTSGNLDCFAVQAPSGAQFECVSLAGESSVDESGMTMPVSGIIVAKFGPQAQADGTAGPMNFGVDWTAPKGSAVVAAFAGSVTAIGPDDKFGLVVRLSHPDGKSTMYGYLQRSATGLAVGSQVTAGQVIGYVGTPASSREPRLHFELTRDGVPVDPIGEMQASTSTGGAVDQFVHRIIYIESGNRCDARNPLSTAVGLGQFIESTWMTTIRLHRPDLLAGRSRREVLDMRINCELARAMTTAFTRDNAAVLRQAGHAVTPGNLYLAHFLGVGGANKVLGSSPDHQIADVFGASHVRANPFERGKSIGFLVAWAAKKMSGGVPKSAPQIAAQKTQPGSNASAAPDGTAAAGQAASQTPAPSAGSGEPMAKFAADPAFAKLKTAVLAFLQ
jgi:murein DD-endopeptidase MepM/ murein hydrolase activator NlpD